VLYGNPLMLSKMVGPNFVVTHSTLMIGYFLSTSIVLILIACLEAAAWNFLRDPSAKNLADGPKIQGEHEVFPW